MNNFIAALRAIGTTRLVIMGIVAAVLLTSFIALTTRLSQPQMALLFGDLSANDTSQIIQQLEQEQIPFELRGDGSQVFVPNERVLRLRMNLAADGLPRGGSIGYELFDKSDGITTSSFVQNINRLRALEGELGRTIRGIDGVQSVRVHLVLPERQLFTRKNRRATASIVLQLRGNIRLTAGQVAAMQNLSASAVPDLEPENVSIVDQRGRLLSKKASDPATAGSDRFEELRFSYENRLQSKVEALLEQSLGRGNVRVQVSADIDFDQTTTNSETFNPDGQVVRSTQTTEETNVTQEGKKNQTVSASQNLPETDTNAKDADNSTQSARTQETVNFEISKTIKTQVHQSGNIKKLSVAVLVNGISTVGQNGNISYQARTADDLKRIETLARSAIGYDEQRGDKLEVVNLRFADIPQAKTPIADSLSPFDLSKSDYFRIGEIVALLVVAVLLILLVLRPLLSRLLAAGGSNTGTTLALPGASTPAIQARAVTRQAIAADPDIARAVESGELSETEYQQLLAAAPDESAIDDDTINLAQIEGRVKASSIKKIGELVEKHPEEAIAIMRTWMYSES